jgi:hypothetical protein
MTVYPLNLKGKADAFNYHYLLNDNPEHSGVYDSIPRLLKTFYTQRNAFYHVRVEDFELFLNPVLGFAAGSFQNEKEMSYQNTRGIEIRGQVGNKIGYYSFISENQIRVPQFYKTKVDSSGVVPGVGYYKTFGAGGYDFFSARGYVTFNVAKPVIVQFGQDRNFVGNGYRSLILSDNGKENLFLKVQTKIWKIQYTNLFSELTDLTKLSGSGGGQSKKYSALHHLSINLGKHLNIGLFENVIFARRDTLQTKGFDINYLNPVIFYRAVEHGLNSSDNVLLGLDFKWNFLKSVSLYGQLVLDEFVKNEVFAKSGWWANKWAIQGGLKYINVFGVNNLDLQIEYNTARPYTYTHFYREQNYVNYNQPLAHPLGANFKEAIGILRYQPFGRLTTQVLIIYSTQGLDSLNGAKNGGNILKDYHNRSKDYGNETGQGIAVTAIHSEFRLTYQMFHNLFTDLRFIYRSSVSSLPIYNYESLGVMFGLRLNLGWGTPFEFN